MAMSAEVYKCYGHALLAGIDLRQAEQRTHDAPAQAELFVGYTQALDELHAVDPGRAQALDAELERIFDLAPTARDDCIAETCRLLADFGFLDAAAGLARRVGDEERRQTLLQELAPAPSCVAFFPDPPPEDDSTERAAAEATPQPAPAEHQLTFEFDL